MATINITLLPDPPSRADPSTFRARADAFMTALPTLAVELNCAAAFLEGAAQAAAGAVNADAFAATADYAAGDVVWSLVDYQSYRRKASGIASADPSTDTAHWAALNIPPAQTAQFGLPVVYDASGNPVPGYVTPSAIRTAQTAAAPADGTVLGAAGWFQPPEEVAASAVIVACAAAVSISIPTARERYEIELTGLYANSAQEIFLRFNNSTAAEYQYMGHQITLVSGASSAVQATFERPLIGSNSGISDLNIGIAGSTVNLTLTLDNPRATGQKDWSIVYRSRQIGTNDLTTKAFYGRWTNTAAITAVDIVPYACLLMGGKYKVIGR